MGGGGWERESEDKNYAHQTLFTNSTESSSERAADQLTRFGTPCVTTALIISADRLSGLRNIRSKKD